MWGNMCCQRLCCAVLYCVVRGCDKLSQLADSHKLGRTSCGQLARSEEGKYKYNNKIQWQIQNTAYSWSAAIRGSGLRAVVLFPLVEISLLHFPTLPLASGRLHPSSHTIRLHTHTLTLICFPDFALHRLAIFLLGILRFPFRHNCFLFFFFQSLYAAHHVWFKALQEYPDDPKVWFFQPLTNWLCVTPFPRSFPCELPNAPRYSATCTFESLSGPGPWACQDTHTHVHNDKYGLWCNLKDQFVQCAQHKS